MGITAKDILLLGLHEKGYDGLFCMEEECGCFLDDLVPCQNDPSLCEPGIESENKDGDRIIARGCNLANQTKTEV